MDTTEHLLSSEANAKRLKESMAQVEVLKAPSPQLEYTREEFGKLCGIDLKDDITPGF
ncbi:MAG: hypothetical protein V3R25_10110 [Nitrosomonadaceae bacterium]